jgi:hypothetical protein
LDQQRNTSYRLDSCGGENQFALLVTLQQSDSHVHNSVVDLSCRSEGFHVEAGRDNLNTHENSGVLENLDKEEMHYQNTFFGTGTILAYIQKG